VLGGKVNWPRQGDYALNRFGIDATAMVMAFFAGDEAWAQTQLLFEEQARTYVVYVPSTYNPAEPMPLALLLHGRFGSGAGTAQYTRLNRVAEEHGFIAVYPDGLQNPGAELAVDTGWNYMRGTPFAPDQEPDDSAFLRDLIADLSIDLSIDPQRIYVAGFSNGGMMAHHLACDDPTQYAAFGSVAGSAYLGMETVCQQETRVSMLIIHGTDDDNVRWEGLQDIINNQLVYVIYPVEATFQYWVAHDGCDPDTLAAADVPATGQSPSSSVRILTLDCPGEADVTLYGVIGGGHNWPGAAADSEEAVAQRINMDIDAGEALWEFFQAHTRTAE
jgi:polyhydroxybutyrate depolymerase